MCFKLLVRHGSESTTDWRDKTKSRQRLSQGPLHHNAPRLRSTPGWSVMAAGEHKHTTDGFGNALATRPANNAMEALKSTLIVS